MKMAARRVLFVTALSGCRAASGGHKAGDSMLPTIDVGTRINVAKLEGNLARGRVVVFRAPEASDREHVKRVVALPGDTISVDGTAIVLNGTPTPRCPVGAWSYADAAGKVHTGELWLEALAGSKWLVFLSPWSPPSSRPRSSSWGCPRRPRADLVSGFGARAAPRAHLDDAPEVRSVDDTLPPQRRVMHFTALK